MRGKSKAPKLIEFKGTTLPVVAATLRSTDVHTLGQMLDQMLGRTPDFFSGDAAVIDLSELSSQPSQVDWPGLVALLKRFQLNPVGVRNAGPWQAAASAAGLSIVSGLDVRTTLPEVPEPEEAPAEPQAPAPAPTSPAPNTLIIDKPLRSGQQVYARGGDLVVLAIVNAGAEAIADGNIHVYAPLRGRALAGARGDHNARIFTTSLEAELVSIAGIYRTFDQGLPADVAGKPAQVRLIRSSEGESLGIEPLKIA